MSLRFSTLKTGTCLLLGMLASSAQGSSAKDVADIRRLMSDYHVAVVHHDGSRLAKFFVPAGSAWFNVLSETAYHALHVKSPDAQKFRASDVASFIKFVTTSRTNLDPEHGPVHIRTDGSIASAFFKFRFLIDGKVENEGSESWQIVKSLEGWRIASIIYSSNPSVGLR